MARIRTLKPEVLEDKRTAELSDTAFRLFISMIVLADDFGNCRADDRWLRGQVWWARGDSPRIAETLGELATAGLILAYRVREQMYVHLRGWEKHQRIDNRGKPRVPGPKDKDAQDVTIVDNNSRGEIPRVAANLGETPLDHDHDPDHEEECRALPDAAALEISRVAIAEINRLAGTSYQPDSKSTLKLCRALAKAKHTAAEALAVIALKRPWLSDAKMRAYFQPSTLLALANFEKYQDELAGKQRRAPAVVIAADDDFEPMPVYTERPQ
jgi:uncharacterized phage protein (TIGR02220 family)